METLTKNATTINQQSAECLINDAPRELDESSFPVGTVAHQGDVILVRIESLPESAKPRKNRQIADGTTQGSRHVVSIGNVFDCDKSEVSCMIELLCKTTIGEQYIGPVFQTTDGTAKLIHPEHGDYHLTGDMTIGCVYQRNLDADEREARVRD